MLVCGEPQKHRGFEVKVYHIRTTHSSSSMSAMEPSASPSPSDAMWCRVVLLWGQCSTALNRAWSPCSASTLRPDTVRTQAPRVMGYCSPGSRCPCKTCSSHRPHCPRIPGIWVSLLHPMCPTSPEEPGIRKHLLHFTCPPWTQVSWHPAYTPIHPLSHGPRCLGSCSTPHCSLPPGHSGVWAHR